MALKITGLPPGRDVDLGRLVGQAVLPFELGAHRRLELGDAVDVGVFGLALAWIALMAASLTLSGRVEVRLAGVE